MQPDFESKGKHNCLQKNYKFILLLLPREVESDIGKVVDKYKVCLSTQPDLVQ